MTESNLTPDDADAAPLDDDSLLSPPDGDGEAETQSDDDGTSPIPTAAD